MASLPRRSGAPRPPLPPPAHPSPYLTFSSAQDHRYNNPVCLVFFEVLRLQLSRHRKAEARRKIIRNLRKMWQLKIVKKALRRKALGDPEALRAKLLNQLEVSEE